MIFKRLFGKSSTDLKRLAKTRGFKQKVVGESHYQKVLSRVCGGKTEFGVKFETDVVVSCNHPNKQSDESVTILIGKSVVGFIPANEAAAIREEIHALDSNRSDFVVSGKIIGGWLNAESEGHFGLVLNVKRPLALA